MCDSHNCIVLTRTNNTRPFGEKVSFIYRNAIVLISDTRHESLLLIVIRLLNRYASTLSTSIHSDMSHFAKSFLT